MTSENVKKCIMIEFEFIDESDLKKHKDEIAELVKGFTREEHIEYLITYKNWYEYKYKRYNLRELIARLEKLKELSLRIPIHMTKPIKFIEYMALARSIPQLKVVTDRFAPLDEYIEDFVSEHLPF